MSNHKMFLCPSDRDPFITMKLKGLSEKQLMWDMFGGSNSDANEIERNHKRQGGNVVYSPLLL